jgi:hypothetical protein
MISPCLFEANLYGRIWLLWSAVEYLEIWHLVKAGLIQVLWEAGCSFSLTGTEGDLQVYFIAVAPIMFAEIFIASK